MKTRAIRPAKKAKLRAGVSDRAGMSRLDFLKLCGVLAGGAVAGCAPMRALFKLYPDRYNEDRPLVDTLLRAFVVAVAPAAQFDDPDLTRIFSDEYYGFRNYLGFFTADLAERSRQLYRTERFDQLTLMERSGVIADALGSDNTTARLYRGAILAAQASFYGSIYDDTKGCRAIGFPGTNSGFSHEQLYYHDAHRFLAPEITNDGNYH